MSREVQEKSISYLLRKYLGFCSILWWEGMEYSCFICLHFYFNINSHILIGEYSYSWPNGVESCIWASVGQGLWALRGWDPQLLDINSQPTAVCFRHLGMRWPWSQIAFYYFLFFLVLPLSPFRLFNKCKPYPSFKITASAELSSWASVMQDWKLQKMQMIFGF